MTSMKLRQCRSVWDSLLNTYPQSFVVHYHKAIGGAVYILELEKVEYIDGISTRNAHSKTAEKLDMKVGQWMFLSYYENTISEKYTHYVDILKHVQIIKF